MEIVCPSCGFKRTIDDDKIPANRKAVVHCKSCGHKFPLKRARSIAVLLSKGGVGKTTTSVNVAAGLALEGQKVLLVDTDTQGQSAYMLGVKPKAGLTELVLGELPAKECVFKARDNLWILAGGKSLAGMKRMIDRKDFGGEMTLTETLSPLESQFDFIVIDSSPGWDPLTVNVLFYAKEVLIPVSLEVMSLQGLSEFIKSLSSIRKYRKEVGIKYIVPTFMDDRIKNPAELLEKLKKIYAQFITEPVRYSVRISEAPAYGMTIYEYAGGSTGAADYQALVKRVLAEGDAEEVE